MKLVGILFAALLLLGGCASVEPPSGRTEIYSSSIFAPHFLLRGRLSVRIDQKIDSTTVQWLRTSELERLQFFTPLGSQVAEIEQLKNAPATLRQGGPHPPREAPSIAALASKMLGVALNTDQVARWVQGVDLIEGKTIHINMGEEQFWNVTADQFRPYGAYRVVSRLMVVRGDIVIKLAVDAWEAID